MPGYKMRGFLLVSGIFWVRSNFCCHRGCRCPLSASSSLFWLQHQSFWCRQQVAVSPERAKQGAQPSPCSALPLHPPPHPQITAAHSHPGSGSSIPTPELLKGLIHVAQNQMGKLSAATRAPEKFMVLNGLPGGSSLPRGMGAAQIPAGSY